VHENDIADTVRRAAAAGGDTAGGDTAGGDTAGTDTAGGGNRLTLITRTDCHLCDVAREALARIAADTGDSWAELDVESDVELEREYGDRVPVILLDGKEHGYWRVEESRLRRDLAR
jgi:Glutaredoxin-like domain (DUF836)